MPSLSPYLTQPNRAQLAVAAPTYTSQQDFALFVLPHPTPVGGSGVYTYAWTWLSRPPTAAATFSDATIAQPSVPPDAPGDWAAQCAVSDGIVTATFVAIRYCGIPLPRFTRNSIAGIVRVGGIEVPPTAPTLTPAQVPAQVVASPALCESALTALVALINSSAEWVVLDTHLGAVSGLLEVVLVGPAPGSAQPNLRVLFCGSKTAVGKVPHANQMLASHTGVVDQLYMGMSYSSTKTQFDVEGGVDPALVRPDYNLDVNPFGADPWSEWIRIGNVLTTDAWNSVDMLDMDEELVCSILTTVGDEVRPFFAGAILLGPRDASGHGGAASLGRIYGLGSAATTAWGTGWAGAVGSFPGTTGANTDVCAVWNPAAPAGALLLLDRGTTGLGAFQTADGANIGQELALYEQTGGALIGILRQGFFVGDYVHGTAVLDADGGVVGYCVAPKALTAADALGFLDLSNLP